MLSITTTLCQQSPLPLADVKFPTTKSTKITKKGIYSFVVFVVKTGKGIPPVNGYA